MDGSSSSPAPRVEVFEAMRPRLFGIAYRMLRTRADAEDVVQDAWLRLEGTPDVRSVEGFLVRTTTRLCLDREKSARAQREEYVGPWLPEPLLSVSAGDGEVERLESINMALLYLIGSLSPLERAVFLLREAFDYGYHEIGEIVGRRPDNCRQIARRARARIQGEGGVGSVDPQEHEELMGAFLQASRTGDLIALESLLHEDAVLLSDGGGKAVAATNPILGRRNVSRFMAGISGKAPEGVSVSLEHLNGLPGAVVRVHDVPVAAFLLQVEEGSIRRVFAVRNPEKLSHLSSSEGPRPTGDRGD